MTEYPNKVAQAIKTVEEAGNTTDVTESRISDDYGTLYFVSFRSIENHPLLSTSGFFSFFKTHSTGRTRFNGGQLHSMSSGTVKINSYRDLRIVTDVYTTRRES